MLKSLWLKFLVLLLAVVGVTLTGTIMFRHFILNDFSAYLEGEAEDKIYLIQADLENSYDRYGSWKTDIAAQGAIRALMSGFEIRLMGPDGQLIVETKSAVANASPLIRKRAQALAQFSKSENNAVFVTYPLFLAGKQIGTLEVRELRPLREDIFLKRSDNFLLLSIIVAGAIAVLLSTVFSRRLTRPVKELASAAYAISRGDFSKRVTESRHDEVGELARSFNMMSQALDTQEALRRRLIADVAHELRTPLSAMRGELEGMMDGLIPNDARRLQSLYEETGRLRNIVNAIEDLNRAEASRLSLDRRPIDLEHFLQNILDRLQPVFQERGVALELACPEGTSMYADPERLSQIFLNLLSNALKACSTGGKVSVHASSVASGVRVVVEDTGRGIGSEDLPHIFERFYHGPGEGLGIGLTIVKELVEAHGACITVESEPGKGSAFIIDFPDVHNSS